MKDLIKALQIFLKYGNPTYPTNCSHDTLYVNIKPELVNDEDKKTLEDLGFHEDYESEGFSSFKFGSC